MAVELTPKERAQVEGSRISPRPQYFDAASLQQQQISEDFEAFLILLDDDAVKAALNWLIDAGDIGKKRAARDAVAFEALLADIEDQEAIQEEVGDLTTNFNNWREKFQSGSFNDVSEVGLVIRDASALAEEIFVWEERMQHLKAVQNRARDRIRSDLPNPQLQELLSWPTPLLAY